MILGASDITKIKTQERDRVGDIGEPFVKLTKTGWVIISPGQEIIYLRRFTPKPQ